MKLRNKKTGEIGYYLHTHRDHKTGVLKVAVLKDGASFSEFKPYEPIYDYDSLAELTEEWQDYEEPETAWFIDPQGDIQEWRDVGCDDWSKEKSIGNYFETKEEAEKAVEKLKALANLRKRGLKFNGWDSADRGLVGEFEIYCDAVNLDGIEQELELVFGREEI